ncbi:MAG: L-threonylcarbamoyladenylate synthase [Patescibacteria group bacterium]
MKVIDQKNLTEAVEALENGQTIIFPTETSYGLGGDATNQEAVDKIFKIKGRKSDKPLLVVVPSIEMAREYLVWNKTVEHIANSYWPGALTVVGEWNKKEKLASGIVSANGTIAVRVTNHPVAKFLSEKLGRPVVATSANLADAGDIYDSKKISVKSDILIDGGVLPHNPPTTIVSVVKNLQILRQGQIKIL